MAQRLWDTAAGSTVQKQDEPKKMNSGRPPVWTSLTKQSDTDFMKVCLVSWGSSVDPVLSARDYGAPLAVEYQQWQVHSRCPEFLRNESRFTLMWNALMENVMMSARSFSVSVWWWISDGHGWTHRPVQARQQHPDCHQVWRWCSGSWACGESVQAVPGGWRNRCYRWPSGSSDLNLIEDLLDVTRLPLRLPWSRRTSPRTPFIVLGACAAIFRQAYKTSTWTNCWVPFGVAAVTSLMHHHLDFQSCAGPFIPNAESISVLIDVFSVCSLIFWAVHIFVLAKLNH